MSAKLSVSASAVKFFERTKALIIRNYVYILGGDFDRGRTPLESEHFLSSCMDIRSIFKAMVLLVLAQRAPLPSSTFVKLAIFKTTYFRCYSSSSLLAFTPSIKRCDISF